MMRNELVFRQFDSSNSDENSLSIQNKYAIE